MGSTRTVNYSVRASKHVERQMIVEVLQRLDRLPPRLDAYRYVGFGGIFFADFLLAHRHLGLTAMTSIEKSRTDRFSFNRPLSCIDLRFGASSDVLPVVLGDLRRAQAPGIVWLDYDGSISATVTADAALVAAEAVPLTLLLVTVNCEPLQDVQQRVSCLARQMGDQMPPQITTGAQLGGWKLAEVSHRLVNGAIEQALVDRNLVLERDQQLHYQQLLRFHYSDGARMLTTGGIFRTQAQAGLVDDAFAGLGQIREVTGDALSLEVPVLTAREVRHLLAQLPEARPRPPAGSAEDVRSPGVPQADVAKFTSIYRYYPLYAEIGGQ